MASTAATGPAISTAKSGGSPKKIVKRKERIAAEPDKSLLTDRNQSGVTGQQVPKAGKSKVREDLNQEVQIRSPDVKGRRDKKNKDEKTEGSEEAADPGTSLDANGFSHDLNAFLEKNPAGAALG